MAKKKTLTINQRLKNEIDRWTEIKNSYPKNGYQTIEEHLKDDNEFLDDFFEFVNIVKAARKRNYINRNKFIDIINSISHYPYGAVIDTIYDRGIIVDDEVYYYKR